MVVCWNNLPNSDRKVIKGWDSSARGFCQNPELASNLWNTSALANWPRVSSTLGRGWTSRRTFELSLCRSTQIWTDPDLFRFGTISEHRGVGSSTLDMIPCDSILHSSSFTLWRRESGTLVGVNRACGCASGCTWYDHMSQTLEHLEMYFLDGCIIILNSVHCSNEVKC